MDSKIITFLNSIYPLSDEIIEELSSQLQIFHYPKNFILLKQGLTCKYIWFLTEGALRYYYTDKDGKESNVWISLDRDIVSDTPSFLFNKPAGTSIQLLEDCALYSIDFLSIDSLIKKYHSFALWYIKLFEQYYIYQIEDRIADLQFLPAKQRYDKLLSQKPDICDRISLGHIASYLNITQETLSRIRSVKK
ncbi:MAG: Crp/Fnr family transcriptional regulator [Spirochaetia bacterium]|nr:Crp/Fnr family transcriptional regulator [Spirochaetia bacterium]